MTETKRALILGAKDNVATTVQEVKCGDAIAAALGADTTRVVAIEGIPYGFKVALLDIAQGEEIYKYGEVIGLASRPIRKGEMVHVHNVEGTRGRGDLADEGVGQ